MAAVQSKFMEPRSRPKRGQIKIKIFKMIAKSMKDLAVGLAGKTMKAAGDGGSCRCFKNPAIAIPPEPADMVKGAYKRTITQNPSTKGSNKITTFKINGGKKRGTDVKVPDFQLVVFLTDGTV